MKVMLTGNKLDKRYQKLLKKIKKKGYLKPDRTGTGTYSLFGETIKHDMRDGFPLLTTKKMFTKGVIEELLWILRGETNIQPLLLKGVRIWTGDAHKKYLRLGNVSSDTTTYKNNSPKEGLITDVTEFEQRIMDDGRFANKWGDLGRIYGAQWRRWMNEDKSIDQISELITKLKLNPDDRRMIVSAWKVDELNTMTLPPCHNFFQCWTRELTVKERATWLLSNYYETGMELGIIEDTLTKNPDLKYRDIEIPKRALSLQWNQRSCDVFLGIPFNIASYGFLLEILGKIVNMVPEKLSGTLLDTHIYTNHIPAVNVQLSNKNIHRLPYLKLSGTFDKIGTYWNEDKFNLNQFLKDTSLKDFKIDGYNSYPTIAAPLSN